MQRYIVGSTDLIYFNEYWVTIGFLGLFIKGRYHTACRYAASVTVIKVRYHGRQWDFIWCNATHKQALEPISFFFVNLLLDMTSDRVLDGVILELHHATFCAFVT